MYRKKIILIIMIALMILPVACSKKPQKKPAPPPVKIGVSVSLPDQDWEKLLQKELKQQAKKDKVQLQWENAKGDAQKQSAQLEKMLKDKVKAVIIQFADPLAAPAMVQQFIAQGIKVVVVGELPENTPMDGFVGVDFKRLGEMQARYLEGLSSQGTFKGNAAILLPEQPTRGILEMADICKADLEKNGMKVEQKRLPAADVASFLDKGVPDVLVIEDAALLQAILQELQLRRLDKQVITVGLDGGKDAARALIGGFHEAEADPEPEDMANQALRAAIDLVKEGSWNYEVQLNNGAYDIRAQLIPVRMITKENIYLLEQRWGKLLSSQKSVKQQGNSGGQGEKDSASGGQGSSSPEGQGDISGRQQQGGQRLLIKTKDGQSMEISVPGQIEQVIIEGGQGQKQGGQQGNKQGGSQVGGTVGP